MANNLTNAEESRLLDLSLNGTFISLLTSVSGETGTGTESSLARQAVSWNAASNGTKTTTTDVVFTFTSGVTITGYALYGALTGDSQRWYVDLTTPIVVGAAGGTVTLPAGSAFTAE